MKKLSLILAVIFLLSTALDAQVDKKRRRKGCGKTRVLGANGHMLKKTCKYKKRSNRFAVWAPMPGH